MQRRQVKHTWLQGTLSKQIGKYSGCIRYLLKDNR